MAVDKYLSGIWHIVHNVYKFWEIIDISAYCSIRLQLKICIATAAGCFT